MDFFLLFDWDNVLPLVAAVSVILLVSDKLYRKIRVKFAIKVNCWFCNSCTKVPYNSYNSWYCPECDQYNGFNADGGYNRPLVEQWSERLNRATWAAHDRAAVAATAADNGLCRFCNTNLELKVRQLARFVPLRPDDYDSEVQQYSDRLERIYRLCGRCDAVLARTLRDKQRTLGAPAPSSPSATLPPNGRPPALAGWPSAAAQAALATLAAAPLLPLGRLPPSLVDAVAPYLAGPWLTGVGCACQTAVFLAESERRGPAVGLLAWLALVTLHRCPLPICNGYAPIAHGVAAAVLTVAAVSRLRRRRERSVAAVRPVRLQKLASDLKTPTAEHRPVVSKKVSPTVSTANASYSAAKHWPAPSASDHVDEDDGLGLGRLSVGSSGGGRRPVTRSQTRAAGHFETRRFDANKHPLFRGLAPATLPPPPASPPPTRASSLSSGFVSRPPTPSPPLPFDRSFDAFNRYDSDPEALESVSRCGLELTPYAGYLSSGPPSPSVSVVHHVGSPAFYAEMIRYESFRREAPDSVFRKAQALLTPALFAFLVASNALVLWKLFGERYFEVS